MGPTPRSSIRGVGGRDSDVYLFVKNNSVSVFTIQ